MLYGIVTHVQSGVGIVYSGTKTYKFSLSDFPSAEVGLQVTFDPVNVSFSSHETWIGKLSDQGLSPVAGILRRIDKIETELLELRRSWELPEAFLAKHAGATDESA